MRSVALAEVRHNHSLAVVARKQTLWTQILDRAACASKRSTDKLPLVLFSLALVFSLALLGGCGHDGDLGNGAEQSEQSPAVSRPNADESEPGVTLKKEAQARAGLRVELLAPQPLEPELSAFGRLEEDPSTSFVVRAPVAGTLHAIPDRTWPALGQSLPAGAVFGRLEPRLLPTDRLNFTTQLATARADLNSSVASVAAAQAAYDRAKALNADNKNVSDKALQEAEARLRSEQAKERAARANVNSLEASLQPGGTIGNRPVIAESGGEVVEIFGQPGEAIEQGASIIRLARLDRLFVRIDLPVGEHISRNDRSALVIPAGFEDRTPLPAELVAVAPATDPHTQGISLLYRLKKTFFGLRPGTAVAAFLRVPGPLRPGVLIPRSAIVQQGGKSWVYVQTGAERFARRAVSLDLPVARGFVEANGFSPGDRAVVVGAQSLLSEEFKSENQTDEY
jgi:membrane fusion protein, multidrug efflux system